MLVEGQVLPSMLTLRSTTSIAHSPPLARSVPETPSHTKNHAQGLNNARFGLMAFRW